MSRVRRTEILHVGDSSLKSHARLGMWASCKVEGRAHHWTFKMLMVEKENPIIGTANTNGGILSIGFLIVCRTEKRLMKILIWTLEVCQR